MLSHDDLCCGLLRYRARPTARRAVAGPVPQSTVATWKTASPRVAIIGAGAAGIATALGLAKHGFAVTLLEQGPRIGGRVRTKEVRQKPYDLGATWLHGRGCEQNPLVRYTEGLPQIQGKPRGCGAAPLTVFVDGPPVDGKVVSRVASAYALALEDCEGVAHGQIPAALRGKELPQDVETAVETILSKSDMKAPTELVRAAQQWRKQLECSISGCDSVSDLSLAAWGEYQEIPSAQRASNRWQGGFSAVLEEAMKDLFRLGEEKCGGVDLHLNYRAETVHWSESTDCCVLGRVDDKEVPIVAQHVVVTASLGALKAQELRFTPPLPWAKRRAVERLGFGTVEKVLMLYPTAWWTEHWSKLRFLWPENCDLEPQWLCSLYGCTPVGETGLEFWISGAAARDMEASSDSEVLAALHRLLLRAVPGAAQGAPWPEQLVRSQWSSEDGFRGSYSFVPVGASGTDIDQLAEPEGEKMTLCFAGEHTHRTYYSTVHGAWWSGLKLAERLVAMYRPKI